MPNELLRHFGRKILLGGFVYATFGSEVTLKK